MAGITTVPRAPTERSFGLSVGTVCLVVAAWNWWRGFELRAGALAALGLGLILAAVIAPTVLRVPNRVWSRFAQVLGWINTRVLLTAMFFAIITPVGIVMRLCGRHPFRAARTDTNWSEYAGRRRERSHFEHMF